MIKLKNVVRSKAVGGPSTLINAVVGTWFYLGPALYVDPTWYKVLTREESSTTHVNLEVKCVRNGRVYRNQVLHKESKIILRLEAPC